MVSANTPLPATAYVPILKGKQAEYGALESCASDAIVPLVEVLAPELAHRALLKAWTGHADDVIWVHALNLDDHDPDDFSDHVRQMFVYLRGEVPAVPVVTISEEPAALVVIREIVRDDQRGAVLRIDAEDILDDATDTTADIAATVEQLGLAPSDCDLVIDAGLLDGTPVVRAAVAEQCVSSLPTVSQWRTVVIAFSGFPTPLSDVVPKSSVRAVPRSDAGAFTLARRRASRPVVFADYTLGTPTYEGVPFTPIPNIRYASGSEWIIHRAEERKGPAEQFRKLARDIVSADYFSGATFSPGDAQIADVASGVAGPGNPTTHLRAGISRHLHVVLERLATLGEP